MMFQVGAPSDFDEWAKLGGPGAEAWKWSEIQKCVASIVIIDREFRVIQIDISGNSRIISRVSAFRMLTPRCVGRTDRWKVSIHSLDDVAFYDPCPSWIFRKLLQGV